MCFVVVVLSGVFVLVYHKEEIKAIGKPIKYFSQEESNLIAQKRRGKMNRVTALLCKEEMGSTELMMVLESTGVPGLSTHSAWAPAGR